MGENKILEEIQELRTEVASVSTTVNEMLEMMRAVLDEVHTDHEKLEKLEVTAKQDHKMIKALEETKRNLEVTGRIHVGRRPVGL